jgi:hypothetical protein
LPSTTAFPAVACLLLRLVAARTARPAAAVLCFYIARPRCLPATAVCLLVLLLLSPLALPTSMPCIRVVIQSYYYDTTSTMLMLLLLLLLLLLLPTHLLHVHALAS